MMQGQHSFTAGELEAMIHRRRAATVRDDDAYWVDLGRVVRQLMLDGSRFQPEVRAAARYQPLQVFNYWDQRDPPADVLECLASWRQSGLDVHTYDRDEADAYLQFHFGGDVLRAFRYAHHPAMQADLFRLGRLHVHGGLYVDADDAYRPGMPVPAFASPVAAMPLEVCRACEKSLVPVVGNPHGELGWQYLNNAPLFSLPGHTLIERTLRDAVGTVMDRRAAGQLARIHADTGPGCLSRVALEYVLERLVAGLGSDLGVSSGWAFLEQARPLAYKRTNRNWRTNAVLYRPAAPRQPADGAAIDLAAASL